MDITLRHETPADVGAIATLTAAAFPACRTQQPHRAVYRQHAARGRRPHPVAGRGAQWHTDRARVRLAGHTQQRRRRLVRAGTGVGAAGQSEPGIGSRLIRQLLAELQERHAAGCVVLGDPNYYGRFGFQAQTALTLPGVPQDYFRAIAFQGALPCGSRLPQRV